VAVYFTQLATMIERCQAHERIAISFIHCRQPQTECLEEIVTRGGTVVKAATS
jgi:hypothetical protein